MLMNIRAIFLEILIIILKNLFINRLVNLSNNLIDTISSRIYQILRALRLLIIIINEQNLNRHRRRRFYQRERERGPTLNRLSE